MPRRFRSQRHLCRQGWVEDRGARPGGNTIYEPGLQDLVSANVAQRRLAFTTELSKAVRSSEAVFIAVGTPSRRGDGHADLSFVYAATRDIAGALEDRTSDGIDFLAPFFNQFEGLAARRIFTPIMSRIWRPVSPLASISGADIRRQP